MKSYSFAAIINSKGSGYEDIMSLHISPLTQSNYNILSDIDMVL